MKAENRIDEEDKKPMMDSLIKHKNEKMAKQFEMVMKEVFLSNDCHSFFEI